VTIIDFPAGGRISPAHPTSRHRNRAFALGTPPSGQWQITYEELAACCAEVVAASPSRVYDADWEELVDWIRSRLAVLDALKAESAS
jgi:hypothetical protein